MAIVSSGALLDVLRQYNLLSKQQIHEVLSLAQGRCADVRMLAKSMIKMGWFSVFQVNQLLAGHGKDLVLGPYQILDRLGKGGQSEVYKARHPEHGWTVALKVIRSEHLSNPAAAEQFFLEMQAMAELDHPNIVQFWDADKADNAYYCAMEFVEGTDLGKVVRLQNYLPPAQAAEYVRQAALGLQHAHEHNLVHRDIKPVNLFLTNQPTAASLPAAWTGLEQPNKEAPPLIKILDWGLASMRTGVEAEKGLRENGQGYTVVGTADYLSPEQAVNPQAVDIRSDIYSLGCTLYYLLTGQTPFAGNSIMQKIMLHQMEEPALVEELNPDVPPALAAIVRRMMAKKPECRFQTPAAVALALKPLCRGDLPTTPHDGRSRPLERACRHEDTPIPSGTILPTAPARNS
jgi:serine/threonine protein kinase